MAISLYLDMRRPTREGTGRLRIAVNRGQRTAYIDLGMPLRPEQWNGSKVVRHPQSALLNDIVTRHKAEADTVLILLKTRPGWKSLNDALKRIGNVTYGKQGRKEVSPLFPKLSSYWARHS